MSKLRAWFRRWRYNGRPIPLECSNYRHGLTNAKRYGVIG